MGHILWAVTVRSELARWFYMHQVALAYAYIPEIEHQSMSGPVHGRMSLVRKLFKDN